MLTASIADHRAAGLGRIVLGSIGPDVLANYEAFEGAGELLAK